MLIFDGHLDLAMNALAYDRDQTWPLGMLSGREAAHAYDDHRGQATVSLSEMKVGSVRCCVATLFVRAARNVPIEKTLRRSDCDYGTCDIAWAAAHGQLAYYRLMESRGHVKVVTSAAELAAHAEQSSPRIGCILLMEGADPLLDPDDVSRWHAKGVRVVSLTHVEATQYAGGNGTDLPLTPMGVKLLDAMRDAGLILDLSHLCDRSLFMALDAFDGPVLASHSNCRALVPGARQISDEQIRLIAQRGGVIGVVMHCGMLLPGPSGSSPPRGQVTLQHVAQHLDHICQLTGSVAHAAIGSDLDGGFGLDRVPSGLDSIADLHKIAAPLRDRGYGDDDIAAILGGNWLRFYAANLS